MTTLNYPHIHMHNGYYSFDFYFCGMDARLEAHFQNRIYYFDVVDRKPKSISISMYTTLYTFVQIGERWVNHSSNKMEMSAGLIAAVLAAAGMV